MAPIIPPQPLARSFLETGGLRTLWPAVPSHPTLKELGSIRMMAEASLNRAQPVQDLFHLHSLASALLLCFTPEADELLCSFYFPHDLSQSLPSSAFAAFPPMLDLGLFNQHELASSKANRCSHRILNHQAGEGLPVASGGDGGMRFLTLFVVFTLTSPLGFYRKCSRRRGCSDRAETGRKLSVVNSGNKCSP